MSDPILEKLKKAIAACPDLSGKMAGVFTNYIQEDEPCCGIFPAGEKRLSVDWAGNERWQYDFTIQMAGFAFQETERMENEITAECLSRWLSENGAEILILGERARDGCCIRRRTARLLCMKCRDSWSTGEKAPKRHRGSDGFLRSVPRRKRFGWNVLPEWKTSRKKQEKAAAFWTGRAGQKGWNPHLAR